MSRRFDEEVYHAKGLCHCAVMVVDASPAFAQSASKAQKQRSLQPSLYGSYGGQKRYTDPDPNIQFEMMRQQNWRKGGGPCGGRHDRLR